MNIQKFGDVYRGVRLLRLGKLSVLGAFFVTMGMGAFPPAPGASPFPGTVVAWGDNTYGQTSIPSGLSGVTAIAAGDFHSLALKSDGTVVAWGDNSHGQTNIPGGLSGVTAITGGLFYSLALKSGGTVVGWGDNSHGQTNIPAGLSGVVAISAGYFHSLALKSDGTVVAWGDNSYGQTSIPAGLSGVTAIAAGAYFSLALKSDGTVAGWGDNTYGQTNIIADTVIAIAAGRNHSLTLVRAGRVVGWGDDTYHQLDVDPALISVTAIAAHADESMLLTTYGTVAALGDNTYGQVSYPLDSGLSGVTAVAAGRDHDLAIVPPTTPITITSATTSATFSVSGTGCAASSNYSVPSTLQWSQGAPCTVTFYPVVSGGAGTQFVFTAWADGPTINPRTITTPTSAATFTANYKTQYQLYTPANPAGGGTVTGQGFYDAGSMAAVVATANAGYVFAGWTPALSPNTASSTVSMTGPANVTANFALITSTTVLPAAGLYGDTVTLSATVSPTNPAVTGTLQFQVDGANVGPALTVSGGGTYTENYTVALPAGTHTVKAIFTSSGVTVLSSMGTSTLAVTAVYVSDSLNNRVRFIDQGNLTTLAGNGAGVFAGDGGPAVGASVKVPFAMAIDAAGSIYIADSQNNRIRQVDHTTGAISTFAGNGVASFSGDGGAATAAGLSNPTGVAVDSSGNVFIADQNNNRIRKVDTSGTITTVAGSNTVGYGGDGAAATSAQLYHPAGVALDAAGNIYIADTYNNVVREVSGGVISTVAGNGKVGYGCASGNALSTGLHTPVAVAFDNRTGGGLLIADSANQCIRKVQGGSITTVAGNGTSSYGGDGGPATSASLNYPIGVAVDIAGDIFIADDANNRIRRVNASGVITTLAGSSTAGFNGDGAVTSKQLYQPTGVAVH